MFNGDVQQLFQASIGRRGNQLGAGDHDLADEHLSELEDRVHHLVLAVLHHASLRAGGDQHLELLHRVHQFMRFGRFDADPTQQRISGSVEQPNCWLEDPFGEHRGAGYEERSALRML